MSINLNDQPAEVITNAPEFDISTTLTEGASYQNLRVRATIYVGGETEAVAVLEQPKGLDDWDFFEVMKSFTGKCNAAIGGALNHIKPAMSAELLTGFTEYAGVFSTFTTAGRAISAAITSGGGGPDYAQTNDLGSAAIGDVYVVGVEYGYADTGAFNATLKMAQGGNPFTGADLHCRYSGNLSGVHRANHIYYFCMPYADTTPYIFLGADSEGTNFNGTFTVHKITDFKNNPGVYFTVKWEEVYENASDVTTIGATRYSSSYLFMPASVRPGESFDNTYVINATAHKFLTRGEDGDMRYKFGIGMEARMMAAHVSPYLNIIITTGVGNQTELIVNAGWVFAVVNDNIASLAATDDDFTVIATSVDSAGTSSYYTITFDVDCELNCYPDIKALSFVGDLGEEIVLFRGLHTLKGVTNKSFYRDVNRIKKVLKAYKYFSQKLRTVYETEGVRKLLHELTYTDYDVWLFDTAPTSGYKVVTVVSDDATITDRNELIQSEIEIEYHE